MRIAVETENLLSIPQVAELLGKPRVTVWRWAKSDKVPTIEMGGHVFILRSVAEELKRTREGNA